MKLKKKFIKDGEEIEILFREPKISDAKALLDFINGLVDENVMIGTTKKYTLKQERKHIAETIREINRKKRVNIIALHNGKIVGACGIRKGSKQVTEHIGDYGIAIVKGYRSMGLGSFLSSLVIKEAKRKLKSEIIILQVFGVNKPAQNLYKKLGFKKFGVLPKGIKHHGKYQDDMLMYKRLK